MRVEKEEWRVGGREVESWREKKLRIEMGEERVISELTKVSFGKV